MFHGLSACTLEMHKLATRSLSLSVAMAPCGLICFMQIGHRRKSKERKKLTSKIWNKSCPPCSARLRSAHTLKYLRLLALLRFLSIMDYDKVIVMDKGRVVEYDTPQALACKESGVFSSLLRNHKNN